jgi:arginine utilization protein RocB
MFIINSEPHQRKNKDIGIFPEGSVGKLMPFGYVRGYMTHIGKVFE